ncbi:hypothetical protein KUTeg_016511 [Tegillarca granosa]|uniref:SSD domain-containing protein n=1 Tax=Tegillarca granosa TaxID=220873 RepID=A0ABQ9EPX3_TEGGR|nr:hypothetical protein KUTeg_016511 [Tegillarca granosa]
MRWHLQKYMYKIGCFIQLHCGKVLFVGILMLCMCCVGLKTANIETDVKELWVEDGGRLSKELKYTTDTLGEGSGTTSELIIQTPQKGENLLTVESLKLHLEVLLKVKSLEVDLYGICKYKILNFSPKTKHILVILSCLFFQIIDHILPCVIITPLDCFWDGAKVLGPTHSVATAIGFPSIKWTNLNPIKFVQLMKDHPNIEMVEKMLNRSGITTAYQEKPCLDPTEFHCPDTAPNKQSLAPPDIGALLTDGCYGFATKYMHWQEDLIVGGAQKNKTGHIVRAEALQSIIQLMAEQDFYTLWHETTKTQSIEWTKEKAKVVLETWQRKFTEVVNGMTNSSSVDHVYAFSSTSLLDIMKEFSDVSVVRVAFGYVLMIFYACISLLRWQNGVQSQSGIGMAGVLLVALSVAAGLGMCSVLGISFNASTTQIIPFLALGLGVDDMFLIAHTYAENGNNKNIPHAEQTGECLKRTGVSVLLTSISNMLAFFSAAIIPIPALRSFSLQAGILIFFNLASVLLVYPAICSWDLKRRDDKRIDIFCCFQSFENKNMVIELQPRSREFEMHEQSPPPTYSPPPPRYSPSPPPSYNAVIMHNTVAQTALDGSHAITSLAHEGTPPPSPANSGSILSTLFGILNGIPGTNYLTTASSQQRLTVPDGISFRERFARVQRECLSTSLSSLATKYYGPFLQRTPVKVINIVE